MTGNSFSSVKKETEKKEQASAACENRACNAGEPGPDPLENKPFSKAFQEKKEDWFDHVPLTVHQLDIIIYAGIAALVIVFILIALEATGIFKL